MNQTDLIANVATRSRVSQTVVRQVIAALQDVVEDAIAKDEQVRITGFLSIAPYVRPARTGRDPRTGESRDIPEKRTVRIRPGKRLEDSAGQV
jgi:nucleoid DNA-binding protein